ncbi:MAG TPA: hypothetical protein VK213_02865 [Bacteroidales bacterium]|nr:hypothetical protein [Bacteroidales bacterium]
MKELMKSESYDRKGQVIILVFLILFLLAGSVISLYFLHRMESRTSASVENTGRTSKSPQLYSSNRYYHEVLIY